jgi:hypothetical protein
MGRPRIPNQERGVTVLHSVKNWEFLKKNTTRGQKLDEFLTVLISEWERMPELRDNRDYWEKQCKDAWKDMKEYRDVISKLNLTISELQSKLNDANRNTPGSLIST